MKARKYPHMTEQQEMVIRYMEAGAQFVGDWSELFPPRPKPREVPHDLDERNRTCRECWQSEEEIMYRQDPLGCRGMAGLIVRNDDHAALEGVKP